jgi:hypothetical protein
MIVVRLRGAVWVDDSVLIVHAGPFADVVRVVRELESTHVVRREGKEPKVEGIPEMMEQVSCWQTVVHGAGSQLARWGVRQLGLSLSSGSVRPRFAGVWTVHVQRFPQARQYCEDGAGMSGVVWVEE